MTKKSYFYNFSPAYSLLRIYASQSMPNYDSSHHKLQQKRFLIHTSGLMSTAIHEAIFSGLFQGLSTTLSPLSTLPFHDPILLYDIFPLINLKLSCCDHFIFPFPPTIQSFSKLHIRCFTKWNHVICLIHRDARFPFTYVSLLAKHYNFSTTIGVP